MAQKKRKPVSTGKSASRGGRKTAESRTQAAQAASARHQTAAVLLFAAAVLLLCLVLIPGGSLWGLLHTFVLGLFGVCAYILPALLVYIAVVAAQDKPIGSISAKLW